MDIKIVNLATKLIGNSSNTCRFGPMVCSSCNQTVHSFCRMLGNCSHCNDHSLNYLLENRRATQKQKINKNTHPWSLGKIKKLVPFFWNFCLLNNQQFSVIRYSEGSVQPKTNWLFTQFYFTIEPFSHHFIVFRISVIISITTVVRIRIIITSWTQIVLIVWVVATHGVVIAVVSVIITKQNYAKNFNKLLKFARASDLQKQCFIGDHQFISFRPWMDSTTFRFNLFRTRRS